MNNKLIKSIVMILIIITTMLILTNISNAASLSISTSKSSVEPGEVFTATITLNGGAGPISASVQNGSGSGTQFLDNGSMSISCTAGNSGTVTISASGTVGDYATEQDVNVSNSKNVTIAVPEEPKPSETTTQTTTTTQTPTKTNPSVPSKTTTPTRPTTSSQDTYTKSSNSKLEKLEIAEGAITPEFDSSVTEYSINVSNEVTKLSIAATTDSSKATVNIEGNEELQIGENTINVIVTAEDGSTTTYTILATRALAELNLQTLSVYYIDENGKKIILELTPEFVNNIYKYTLSKELPYTVENLQIDATSTRENAEIEITGNENLKTGNNEIAIRIVAYNKKETNVDEITEDIILENEIVEEKTYYITVTKEEEPVVVPVTTMGKIKNFFTGFTTKIGSWATKNFDRIISGMLLIVTAVFAGLTIYFVADYKNYKNLLAKLAEFNKAELMEKANVALNVKKTEINETQGEKDTSEKVAEFIEEARKEKAVKGRRYK